MSSQIFKHKIPNELLFDLLEQISMKTNKYYIFNNNSYKKGIFNVVIDVFIESCKQFYHVSKYKYLDRKLTYNNFTTILRQICKCNQLVYTSHIVYDKSDYNILYYIYFLNDPKTILGEAKGEETSL